MCVAVCYRHSIGFHLAEFCDLRSNLVAIHRSRERQDEKNDHGFTSLRMSSLISATAACIVSPSLSIAFSKSGIFT